MKLNKWDGKFPNFLLKPKIYMPLIIAGLLLLIIAGSSLAIGTGIGMIQLFMILAAAALIIYVFFSIESVTEEYIINISDNIQTVENEILLNMPVGMILFDEDGDTIQWINPYTQRYFFKKDVIGSKLSALDSELYKIYQDFYHQNKKESQKINWNDGYFEMTVLHEVNALYFLDITKYGEIAKNAANNRIVIGYVLIDNYDETVPSMSDRRKSTIDNFMTKQLSNWVRKHESFIKRLDDDRFLLVTTYGKLLLMEEERFSIINSIRESTSKANYPLTISMGISYQNPDEELGMHNIAGLAQSNLDLALSRGGDQVVIKTNQQKARYYGGKTNPMEKRTHVRSRQIATTIATMMKDNDSIFVMGHAYPDMDAIGASLGIRRIAEMNGKKCYIVIDEEHINSDIQRLLGLLRQEESIAKSIIPPGEAEKLIKSSSLLFLVDVHRPSITVAPTLINKVNGVVIIDHHRKGEEVPDNILLEYIEPYASSASELIVEFFEYQEQETAPIIALEATTMLTGIIVDTRNFSLRTGSRTFDAASYLKSVGADSILIQKLLKEDLEDYLNRNHLVQSVTFVNPNLGIATGEEDVVYDAVTAAQAADTLLTMRNIDASFVVFKRKDGRIGISARSIGNVNVQTIMEELGGGGHLSNAATQIENATIAEVVEKLQNVIKNKQEE